MGNTQTLLMLSKLLPRRFKPQEVHAFPPNDCFFNVLETKTENAYGVSVPLWRRWLQGRRHSSSPTKRLGSPSNRARIFIGMLTYPRRLANRLKL